MADRSEDDGNNKPSLHARGVRSGEIFVRMNSDALCAVGGAAHGLAPALRALAIDRPTLEVSMAPSTHKLESLQRQRHQLHAKRERVRQRYDATRAAVDAIVQDPKRLVEASEVRTTKAERYAVATQQLAQLYQRCAMDGALQYYALLEEERARIAAWQQKEITLSQDRVRAVTRRHALTSFAVHLGSETLRHIRLSRLIDGDAQRARCVKAAQENVKKGFFDTKETAIDVTDVYKIDNRPLLAAFERWIAQATEPPKVKGLFCSVPVESLEHCVVWGMFPDEAACATSLGGVDQPVFNRPAMAKGDDAPGTQRRYVAQERVDHATAMAFPRRFSRYSTLRELQDVVASDVDQAEPPVRYLALCRVAMDKIQRVATAKMDNNQVFPAQDSVGSVFISDDEEYVVRYPEAVVPEFLVEYRFVRQQAAPQSDATEGGRLIPVSLSSRHHDPLPSVQFEASAKHVIDALYQNNASLRPRALSLVSEMTTIPPVFQSGSVIVPANAHSKHEELTTEKALEICGRRRRIIADDLEHLRRLLWETTKTAWDQLSIPIRQAPKQDEVDAVIERRSEDKVVRKKQSLKAKKLYGELALERQIQASDVARLEALVKNSKLKKKDATKPRPFR